MTTPSAVMPSRAAAILHQSSIPTLRNLIVEESDRVVVIAGQVNSYYLKQLAQETVMPVLGQRELINRVNVIRNEQAQ